MGAVGRWAEDAEGRVRGTRPYRLGTSGTVGTPGRGSPSFGPCPSDVASCPQPPAERRACGFGSQPLCSGAGLRDGHLSQQLASPQTRGRLGPAGRPDPRAAGRASWGRSRPAECAQGTSHVDGAPAATAVPARGQSPHVRGPSWVPWRHEARPRGSHAGLLPSCPVSDPAHRHESEVWIVSLDLWRPDLRFDEGSSTGINRIQRDLPHGRPWVPLPSACGPSRTQAPCEGRRSEGTGDR